MTSAKSVVCPRETSLPSSVSSNDTWTGLRSTTTLTAPAHVAATSTRDPTFRLPSRFGPPSSRQQPRYAARATLVALQGWEAARASGPTLRHLEEPDGRRTHGAWSPIQDVRVDHRRPHVAMSEEGLDRPDVAPTQRLADPIEESWPPRRIVRPLAHHPAALDRSRPDVRRAGRAHRR